MLHPVIHIIIFIFKIAPAAFYVPITIWREAVVAIAPFSSILSGFRADLWLLYDDKNTDASEISQSIDDAVEHFEKFTWEWLGMVLSNAIRYYRFIKAVFIQPSAILYPHVWGISNTNASYMWIEIWHFRSY